MTTTFPESGKKWHMAGTEGTGHYLVLCETEVGRVGTRDLHNGRIRVRVEVQGTEPLEQLSGELSWKQHCASQKRHSIVCLESSLTETLELALTALAADSASEWNEASGVSSHKEAFLGESESTPGFDWSSILPWNWKLFGG